VTSDERIAHALKVLRYLSNDWELTRGHEGFASDVEGPVAEMLCDQFKYDELSRREVRRIFSAVADILDAISSEDNSKVSDPDSEEGP